MLWDLEIRKIKIKPVDDFTSLETRPFVLCIEAFLLVLRYLSVYWRKRKKIKYVLRKQSYSIFQIYNLGEYGDNRSRVNVLKKWHETGGVMIAGYEMFRLLASGINIKYKPWRLSLAESLLDPGGYFLCYKL